MKLFEKQSLKVSELNAYVKTLLMRDPLLNSLSVVGEVSGFKRYYTGTCFFTLKDANAAVSCVMYRQSADLLNFTPQDGMKVTVNASACLYEKEGRYQLQVTKMSRGGEGELYLQFEALKRKLLAGRGTVDPFSPKVVRAAMGSAFRLPFRREGDLCATLEDYAQRGYEIIVSDLQGAPFYGNAPAGEKLVLVIGNEAKGVSEAVKDCATKRLRLPMRGGAESLNAAVAAGIMMYELTKGLGD